MESERSVFLEDMSAKLAVLSGMSELDLGDVEAGLVGLYETSCALYSRPSLCFCSPCASLLTRCDRLCISVQVVLSMCI